MRAFIDAGTDREGPALAIGDRGHHEAFGPLAIRNVRDGFTIGTPSGIGLLVLGIGDSLGLASLDGNDEDGFQTAFIGDES